MVKFKIYEIITSLVDSIVADQKNPKEKTFLYSIFGDKKIDNRELYPLAVEIFTGREKSQNKLTVGLGFNLDRAAFPCVHISRNTERDGFLNAIGRDNGVLYIESSFADNSANFTKEVSFDASYDLLITGSSHLESEIIFETLRYLIVSSYHIFEANGFTNIMLSTADLNLSREFGVPNLFTTNIAISFIYCQALRTFEVANVGNSLRLKVEYVIEKEVDSE